MSVYVDSLKPCPQNEQWKYDESCHLFTDGDIKELHLFASFLGMKREWFQPHEWLPHYDLTAGRRARALKMGALPGDDKVREMYEAQKMKKSAGLKFCDTCQTVRSDARERTDNGVKEE